MRKASGTSDEPGRTILPERHFCGHRRLRGVLAEDGGAGTEIDAVGTISYEGRVPGGRLAGGPLPGGPGSSEGVRSKEWRPPAAPGRAGFFPPRSMTTMTGPGVPGATGGRAPGGQRRRLSESVAKARIVPERRKRTVDIPCFFSRLIPARGAFATDSDTIPPQITPGAPRAPRHHVDSGPRPGRRAARQRPGPSQRPFRPLTPPSGSAWSAAVLY